MTEALAGERLPADHTDDNPSWVWRAGGVISCAEEVADFTEGIVAGSLLDETTRQWRLASLKPMNAAATGAAASLGFGTYGLGLEGAGPMFGHPGNMVGFSGLAVHDPTAGNTVIVLATVYLTPQGDAPQNVLFVPILAQLCPEIAARLAGGRPRRAYRHRRSRAGRRDRAGDVAEERVILSILPTRGC
ncbi:serine hydrolase [Mycolicibacterium lacusdiani]|uniref:serine hydrolase n=1 Tax=Mycolicibacterium lacusdiani TaxID=2895283 RepID=UPI001F2EFDD1|nr:serine hydrolase [Mycolicibacterium lacusdiani]